MKRYNLDTNEHDFVGCRVNIIKDIKNGSIYIIKRGERGTVKRVFFNADEVLSDVYIKLDSMELYSKFGDLWIDLSYVEVRKS